MKKESIGNRFGTTMAAAALAGCGRKRRRRGPSHVPGLLRRGGMLAEGGRALNTYSEKILVADAVKGMRPR